MINNKIYRDMFNKPRSYNQSPNFPNSRSQGIVKLLRDAVNSNEVYVFDGSEPFGWAITKRAMLDKFQVTGTYGLIKEEEKRKKVQINFN